MQFASGFSLSRDVFDDKEASDESEDAGGPGGAGEAVFDASEDEEDDAELPDEAVEDD